ncbi:MAG: DUF2283 domain-containing protein [Thermoproteales archaeon]|nr:DUF2283 domain-containing protein [Thermoproteales archaeon]
MVKRVYYDYESDILYIFLKEGSVEDTIEANEDVFIELGENGEVVGIEIWKASKNILEPISKTIAQKIKESIAVK